MLAVLAAVTLASSATAAATIASISTVMADGKNSAAESVYDWKTEHCANGRPLAPCTGPSPCQTSPYRRDVPDAPAMAWRDPASNLTYVAPGDSRGTWLALRLEVLWKERGFRRYRSGQLAIFLRSGTPTS